MHNNIVNHNQNVLISKYFAKLSLNMEKKVQILWIPTKNFLNQLLFPNFSTNPTTN